MTIAPILGLALMLAAAPDSGFVSVTSERPGLPVYVNGDFLGTTPLVDAPYPAGEYSLTVVPSDSLERLYWNLRNAGLGRKLSALWDLARIDAASARVDIRPGYEVDVALSERDMNRAASNAKWLVYGGTSAVFVTGALLGVVIGLLAR